MSLHRRARDLRRNDYIEIGTRVYRVFAYARFEAPNGTERRALLLFLKHPKMGETSRFWYDAEPNTAFRICPFEPGPF